jgi:DNA-binding beta-propeller fold protein YncE
LKVDLLVLALLVGCTPGDEPSDDSDVGSETDPQVGPACDEPGTICTIAGRPGELGFDGDGNAALETMLYFPSGLAWSPEGRLVVDDFNNMRIRELTDDGRLVTIAGSGIHGWAVPGPALASPLENPVDVAFLPDGTLVVDELHTGRLLAVKDGTIAVLAGDGEEGYSGDGGPAADATLDNPAGVATADDGTVYVSDTGNHCVRFVRDATIETLVGDGTAGMDDGAGHVRLNRPQHVRVDAERHRLLVADSGNHVVRAIDLGTHEVTIVAGTGEDGSDGDGGPATSARLSQPYGVAVDLDGGLLIADLGANRLRRVAPDGTIDTIAGTGDKAFSGDGGPAAAAALAGPSDVLVGPDGAIYVADMFNGVVRRITR